MISTIGIPLKLDLVKKFLIVYYNHLYCPRLGVMAREMTSARDPIFYRWHQHIDDMAQRFYAKEPR